MSKRKFKVGDKVIMEGPQYFRGRECTDVHPPVTGEIIGIPHGEYEVCNTYNVRWENGNGGRGSNYMDERCLAPAGPTDEEMAEVMKSLGVEN